MKNTRTPRGFDLIQFEDYNGINCSIQTSSADPLDSIWFGVDKDSKMGTRMHLNHDQLKEIIPILQLFLDRYVLFEKDSEKPCCPECHGTGKITFDNEYHHYQVSCDSCVELDSDS